MEAEVADAKARRVKEGLLKVKDEASDDRRVTTIARRKYFMMLSVYLACAVLVHE